MIFHHPCSLLSWELLVHDKTMTYKYRRKIWNSFKTKLFIAIRIIFLVKDFWYITSTYRIFFPLLDGKIWLIVLRAWVPGAAWSHNMNVKLEQKFFTVQLCLRSELLSKVSYFWSPSVQLDKPTQSRLGVSRVWQFSPWLRKGWGGSTHKINTPILWFPQQHFFMMVPVQIHPTCARRSDWISVQTSPHHSHAAALLLA